MNGKLMITILVFIILSGVLLSIADMASNNLLGSFLFGLVGIAAFVIIGNWIVSDDDNNDNSDLT